MNKFKKLIIVIGGALQAASYAQVPSNDMSAAAAVMMGAVASQKNIAVDKKPLPASRGTDTAKEEVKKDLTEKRQSSLEVADGEKKTRVPRAKKTDQKIVTQSDKAPTKASKKYAPANGSEPAPIGLPVETLAPNQKPVVPAAPNRGGAFVPKEGALYPSPNTSPKLPALGDSAMQDPRQARLVRLKDGVNEVIYASLTMPNRIATPFAKPKVIDVDTVDWKVVGQDVYIVPKSKDPSGIFITDESPGSAVASITVVPKDIIGQNVILSVEKPVVQQIGAAKDLKDNSSDYLDQIKSLMKIVSTGGTPPGFTELPLNVGVVRIEKTIVNPIKQFSGQNLDFFVYSVQSTSSLPLELQESSFYVDGVKAISFWPNIVVLPKESTLVYILMEKSR